MKCDQCEALMINGVFCHETGCPNQRKRYDEETEQWRTFYHCRECGGEVWEGDSCCTDDEQDDSHGF